MITKEQILREIQRLATENGGRPVGRTRFEHLTGIRESDWLGRYWRTWNGALADAGFEPNTFQLAKFSEKDLLRSLSELTQNLNRFPTVADRKLWRRSHPDFPSAKVFYTRLGPHQEVLRRLSEFSAENPELADVHEICDSLLLSERAVTSSDRVPSVATGFVYLARSGKHYKIGRSNDTGRRLYDIKLQLPERLELIHSIETDDPVGIERYWHQRFADRRGNGEWFDLNGEDVAAFKRRRKFM